MRFGSALGIALLVKLYVLLVLYILFLKTDLRVAGGTFLFLAEGESAAQRTQAISRNFWDRLTPYDGQWYLDISAKGYRTFPVEPRANAEARAPRGNFAFFPLLPAILSAATAIFGAGMLPVVLLALLVASACGVAFSGLLAREFSIPAGLTLALLLAFPTAPFQLVLYTESLFLPLSAGALWLALRRRAGWAALAVGGLCGLSRPQGILLVLPYFTEFLLPAIRRRERLSWSAWLRRLAVVASPSAGVIAMGYFSAVAAGSPLAFLKVQSGWGRSYELSNLLTSLGSAVDYAGPRSDLLGVSLGVGLLPVLWRRLPLSLALYGTAVVALPLSTGSLLSMGRFLSVSIPHFLALALCLKGVGRRVQVVTVGALAVLQVLLLGGLVAWLLVG